MNQYQQNLHLPDLHLIEAVKQGNLHSFNTLVARYQPRVLKIVARYVRDPNEVSDVSQEVFLKAFRALSRFRAESSFYTWLYRIATNTAKNYLVAQSRRLPELDGAVSDVEHFLLKNAPRETSTPERILIRDEIEHTLYHTIERLPKDLRRAITLREMEGLSYEEIAVVMDCPVGTVRSRIFRARSAIDRSIGPFLRH